MTVSLRIRGDDLNPQEITAALGTDPASAVRKGEAVAFEGIVGKAPTGVWLLKLQTPQAGSVDDQVRAILNAVPNDSEIWNLLTGRFSCELFIGVFLSEMNQGFDIPPATLKEIADKGLSLAFDVYYSTVSHGPQADFLASTST
jgi:hypothetical protein